jgi:hypothetical protein
MCFCGALMLLIFFVIKAVIVQSWKIDDLTDRCKIIRFFPCPRSFQPVLITTCFCN